MAVRKKLAHDQKTREKIQTSQLINRLENHVLGKVELTSTQVTAALGLIKKTLPDLTAVEHSGEIGTGDTISLTESEILARLETLTGSGVTEGTAEANESKEVTH